MSSQLQRDLYARISDRLGQWLHDSAELYRMAGLSPRAACDDAFCALTRLTVRGYIVLPFDAGDQHLLDLIKEMLEIERKIIAKQKKTRAKATRD